MFTGYAQCCIPKRYIVTALAFVGCFSMYALRVALGIALVDMTSEQTVVIGNQTAKTVSQRFYCLSHKEVITEWILYY